VRVLALLAYRAEEACICLSPSISLFPFTHSTVIGSTTQARGSCCKCGIDVADCRSLRTCVVRTALRPGLFWGSSLTLLPPRKAGTTHNRLRDRRVSRSPLDRARCFVVVSHWCRFDRAFVSHFRDFACVADSLHVARHCGLSSVF